MTVVETTPYVAFGPRRRALIILIFGGLWTLGSFATDLFLPAMPAAAEALGASESAVALSVTTFLMGLGLGQLIAGPVSDGRGRRPTLLAGLAVFTASAVVCTVAPSVEILIAMRLVQGMAAAFGLAIPNAMVTDYARGREAAKLICKQRYEQFGCAGMGSKIKAIPLDVIAARYKAGELAQIVK